MESCINYRNRADFPDCLLAINGELDLEQTAKRLLLESPNGQEKSERNTLPTMGNTASTFDHETVRTGLPSTSILGAMPSPGRVLAAIRPLTRRARRPQC